MLHEFSYHRPDSLDAALTLLSTYGADATAFSGGTDLLVNVRAGLMRPRHVVDLKGVDKLHELSWSESNGLSIGACVTVNELVDHPVVRERFMILSIAGAELATFQLRNRATVVGNVVTASPCGDMAGPLLVLGGEVVLASSSGERSVPLGEFITGVKKTIIRPEEIVVRIVVPNRWAGAAGGYEKLKRIKGHDLGVVSVTLIKHEKGVRAAVGSAAPTPVLIADMGADVAYEAVQAKARSAINPIDDVRATAEYRSFMVNAFIKRLMTSIPAPGSQPEEASA